jgi:hypothetical protein
MEVFNQKLEPIGERPCSLQRLNPKNPFATGKLLNGLPDI